ncbi:MAG TPA: tetratricopeptide repeat protein [Abditibacteriaceae bacterium]|jgi:tetratricopeptide (TPR) repeat protein
MFNPFKKSAPEEKAAMERNNEAARADLLWKTGSRFLARKKYDNAIESMRQAYELEPSRLEGRLNLGAALFLTGQHQEAIGHFKYVLAFDGQNTMALLNLAAAHDALGQLDESIAVLETLIERRPQWRDAHYNLGVAYYKQKNYPKAEDALRAELQLNPENTLARELLNTIYRLPHLEKKE